MNGYRLHNLSSLKKGSKYQTICSSRLLLLDQPVGAGVKKPLHYSGEPDIFMHAIGKRMRSERPSLGQTMQ
jgi:hypothetical protein